VIATGARYRRLAVDGLKAFEGPSVHYWASPLEAKLCSGQEVALVGAGNSAGQAAEDIGAAMPERIECVDDRSLLVADHPHFLEIDAERRQIFRNIADVLVLGAAGQDLATD
jgi:thioredoxin reductase (NADPH)